MPPQTENVPLAGAPARPQTAISTQIGIALAMRLRSLAALVVLCLVFSHFSPVYLSWENLVTMTQHVSVTAVLATGMTFVILTAGIDLSVGSIAALSGVAAGYLILNGLPILGR